MIPRGCGQATASCIILFGIAAFGEQWAQYSHLRLPSTLSLEESPECFAVARSKDAYCAITHQGVFIRYEKEREVARHALPSTCKPLSLLINETATSGVVFCECGDVLLMDLQAGIANRIVIEGAPPLVDAVFHAHRCLLFTIDGLDSTRLIQCERGRPEKASTTIRQLPFEVLRACSDCKDAKSFYVISKELDFDQGEITLRLHAISMITWQERHVGTVRLPLTDEHPDVSILDLSCDVAAKRVRTVLSSAVVIDWDLDDQVATRISYWHGDNITRAHVLRGTDLIALSNDRSTSLWKVGKKGESDPVPLLPVGCSLLSWQHHTQRLFFMHRSKVDYIQLRDGRPDTYQNPVGSACSAVFCNSGELLIGTTDGFICISKSLREVAKWVRVGDGRINDIKLLNVGGTTSIVFVDDGAMLGVINPELSMVRRLADGPGIANAKLYSDARDLYVIGQKPLIRAVPPAVTIQREWEVIAFDSTSKQPNWRRRFSDYVHLTLTVPIAKEDLLIAGVGSDGALTYSQMTREGAMISQQRLKSLQGRFELVFSSSSSVIAIEALVSRNVESFMLHEVSAFNAGNVRRLYSVPEIPVLLDCRIDEGESSFCMVTCKGAMLAVRVNDSLVDRFHLGSEFSEILCRTEDGRRIAVGVDGDAIRIYEQSDVREGGQR